MQFTKKKAAAVLAGGAMVVAGSGIAYAYWTTQGAGDGSATSSQPATATQVTLSQVGTLTGFVPGGAAQDVMVKAHNDATYSQNIGNITVTVLDVKDSSDNVVCAASNWLVTEAADNIGTVAGSSDSAAAGVKAATLQLKDLSSNQDGCQNVSPVLHFAAAKGA